MIASTDRLSVAGRMNSPGQRGNSIHVVGRFNGTLRGTFGEVAESGRTCLPAKEVTIHVVRGFKSHPLRSRPSGRAASKGCWHDRTVLLASIGS